MENFSKKMTRFAPIVVRIGLSLVFLWFGSQQLMYPGMWLSFIPDWALAISHISALTLIHLNGSFEIIFGLFLLTGYFTRVTALLLALHLLNIMFAMGYTSIGVRDFGLSMAAISIFLYGADSLSLDKYLERKSLSI